MVKMFQKNQKELNQFFEAIEKVATPSDPRSQRRIYDLGLIIFEPNSSLRTNDIYNLFPPGKARLFLLNNKHEYESFLKELVIANREGQWFLVDCQADLSPTIITVLKQLSEDNAFTVPHFEGQELFRMDLNPKTRIIFCLDSDFLGKEITYPFFMNLFGPVIRI
jgi:hypothetical protein